MCLKKLFPGNEFIHITDKEGRRVTGILSSMSQLQAEQDITFDVFKFYECTV